MSGKVLISQETQTVTLPQNNDILSTTLTLSGNTNNISHPGTVDTTLVYFESTGTVGAWT